MAQNSGECNGEMTAKGTVKMECYQSKTLVRYRTLQGSVTQEQVEDREAADQFLLESLATLRRDLKEK